MDLDATGKQLGERLALILDATPREQHPTVLIKAINTAIDGVKAAVLDTLNQEIVKILGEHYDGPGKLRDRVRALEEIAAVARKVIRDDYPILMACDELRTALTKLDATQAG
jgi:hypothetical protein